MDDRNRLELKLKQTEAPMLQLVSERKAIEDKLASLNSPAEDWVRHQLRRDVIKVNVKIDDLQVEQCSLRIAVKSRELENARLDIPPLEADFDKAMAQFVAARIAADAVGFQLQTARARVSGLESAIREAQQTIEQIEQSRIRGAA